MNGIHFFCWGARWGDNEKFMKLSQKGGYGRIDNLGLHGISFHGVVSLVSWNTTIAELEMIMRDETMKIVSNYIKTLFKKNNINYIFNNVMK